MHPFYRSVMGGRGQKAEGSTSLQKIRVFWKRGRKDEPIPIVSLSMSSILAENKVRDDPPSLPPSFSSSSLPPSFSLSLSLPLFLSLSPSFPTVLGHQEIRTSHRYFRQAKFSYGVPDA